MSGLKTKTGGVIESVDTSAVRWAGTWDSGRAYVPGESVRYSVDSKLYQAKAAGTNKTPGGGTETVTVGSVTNADAYSLVNSVKIAQPFTPTVAMTVKRISVPFVNAAPAGNIKVGIASAVGTTPTWLGFVTVNQAISAGTTYDFDLPTALVLAAGTQYWVVLEADNVGSWGAGANRTATGVTVANQAKYDTNYAQTLNASFRMIFWLRNVVTYWELVV